MSKNGPINKELLGDLLIVPVGLVVLVHHQSPLQCDCTCRFHFHSWSHASGQHREQLKAMQMDVRGT